MLTTASSSLPGCEMTAVTRSDKVLTITVHSTASTARCRRCGESSQRIYRYDTRRPRDLPRWEYAVRLVLHVRRFRCVNATCMTQTLTECLPQTVRPVPPGNLPHRHEHEDQRSGTVISYLDACRRHRR
jgi:transposase